jgi:photosynthetic reaction center H subunit
MQTGAITTHIDVAQIVLYAFFLFFIGLCVYLLREGKREGFPLVRNPGQAGTFEPGSGFTGMPSPKTFLLGDGHTIMAPRPESLAERHAHPLHAHPEASAPGSALVADRDPMIDGLGSGAYADRLDEVDRTFDDSLPKIVPLRVATDFFLAPEDPDPRGYAVHGLDHVPAGTVVDAWIDRSEVVLRYLEVELVPELGGHRVLLGMNDAQIHAKRQLIDVPWITSAQFARVPVTKHPEQVTMLEEDKITAYYAGGELYATPGRSEPLL